MKKLVLSVGGFLLSMSAYAVEAPLGVDIYSYSRLDPRNPSYETVIEVAGMSYYHSTFSLQWRLGQNEYNGGPQHVRVEDPLSKYGQNDRLELYIHQDLPSAVTYHLSPEELEVKKANCVVFLERGFLHVFYSGYCHFEPRDGKQVLIINDSEKHSSDDWGQRPIRVNDL